jgi:hypothetical protein
MQRCPPDCHRVERPYEIPPSCGLAEGRVASADVRPSVGDTSLAFAFLARGVDSHAGARQWFRWRHAGPVAGGTRVLDWSGLLHPMRSSTRLTVTACHWPPAGVGMLIAEQNSSERSRAPSCGLVTVRGQTFAARTLQLSRSSKASG